MKSLVERLGNVESMLTEVLGLLRERQKRSEYQRRYYEEKKAEQRQGLKNPDCNNLDLPMGWDKRLRDQVRAWAELAFRFAETGKTPYAFMEYLAFVWNNCTYWHKVITRSGGYNHVFIGFSGTKPLRSKCTDNDLFGCVKRTTFSRTQRLQFGEALWWRWGYGVLGKVVFEMQEDDRWDRLSAQFTKPMLLMMGGFGQYEVRHGLIFDPSEDDPLKVGKAYAYAKPNLDRGWAACMKGLFAKVTPHAEFIDQKA